MADSHPAEIRADFRSRFNISFDDVGESISWIEAVYLVSVLMRDPTSWLQSAYAGWKYPVSHEWMLLAELFDLEHQVNSKKKVKPLPRPWPSQNAKRVGKSNLSRDDVLRNLERMNPRES